MCAELTVFKAFRQIETGICTFRWNINLQWSTQHRECRSISFKRIKVTNFFQRITNSKLETQLTVTTDTWLEQLVGAGSWTTRRKVKLYHRRHRHRKKINDRSRKNWKSTYLEGFWFFGDWISNFRKLSNQQGVVRKNSNGWGFIFC